MKKAGIIIIVVGVIMTIFTAFTFFTKEKVVDIGKVEISANKRHKVNWSPLYGVVVIAIGAAFLLIPAKK